MYTYIFIYVCIYICIYRLSYINSFNPLQKSYEISLFISTDTEMKAIEMLTYPGFHKKLELSGVLMRL